MASISMAVMDIPSQLPYHRQCHIHLDAGEKLERSFSALSSVSFNRIQDSDFAGENKMENNPDASLPAIVALCSVLLFKYTASTAFKFTVSYKPRHACTEKVRKIDIQLTLQHDTLMSQLVLDTRRLLQSVMDVDDMPPLHDVNYVCVNDQTNESSEIVDMSIAGGLYFRFKSTASMFTTTFSFAKLLSFSQAYSINIKSHWISLLDQVRKLPEQMAYQRACDISILGVEERHTLLNRWNKRPEPELYDKIDINVQLLHMLFERQVELHPDNVAIIHRNPANPRIFSYQQANTIADKVAMYLLSHSKKCNYLSPTWLEDTFVAHLFPRCAESYIAMLGILKSGAAYVPLDPAFPMDRITYILQDCKAKFIITTVEIGIRLKKYLNDMKRNGQGIATEVLFWEDIDTGNSRTTDYLTVMDLEFRSRARINANSACYVIYTSGIA